MVNLLSDGSVPQVQDAKLFQTRPSQHYDCEDTARAILNIHNNRSSARNSFIPCSILITRLGPNKAFQLTVHGDFGSLQMDGDLVELNLLDESKTRNFSKMTSGLKL